MPVLVLALIVCAVLGAALWIIARSDPQPPRTGPGFDPITGGGTPDLMDPERGVIGPSEEDLERFGG